MPPRNGCLGSVRINPGGGMPTISILYQNFDATWSFLHDHALAAAATGLPAVAAVPRTQHVAGVDVELLRGRVAAGSEIVLEIGQAGLPFGAGPHQCPGSGARRGDRRRDRGSDRCLAVPRRPVRHRHPTSTGARPRSRCQFRPRRTTSTDRCGRTRRGPPARRRARRARCSGAIVVSGPYCSRSYVQSYFVSYAAITSARARRSRDIALDDHDVEPVRQGARWRRRPAWAARRSAGVPMLRWSCSSGQTPHTGRACGRGPDPATSTQYVSASVSCCLDPRPRELRVGAEPAEHAKWFDTSLPCRHSRRDRRSSHVEPAAADRLLHDHVPQHLVGALADDHQRRVAVVALDVELGRVAVPAVDADRVERDLGGHLRAEQLGHAGFHVGPPSASRCSRRRGS